MNAISQSLLTSAMMALLLTSCDNSSTKVEPLTAANTSVTDGWLGQWYGPEGTFLLLTGGNGQYTLTIQDLDGPSTFPGVAAGNQIAFQRHGIEETLHASSGADTGMKWLSEKSNCLTVRTGEGYCRD